MALPNEEDLLKPTEAEGDEVEVEVVDDTPAEDRGRRPLPEGEVEPSEDEMEEYSEAVKKRISKMRHGLHDERRAKEAAQRERDEALALAKRVWEEKQALDSRYKQGENAFINQAKEKVDLSMAAAKRDYKAAYELGDADAMADAQEKLARIAAEARETERWVGQAAQRAQNAQNAQNTQNAGQVPAPVLQSPQTSSPQVPEPDPDAVSWAAKNKWFGQNKIMTSTAYGVHDELVAEGIDPRTEAPEYYKKLNARMREIFPQHEWGDIPKKKTITSVVAPVTRTTKTARRVTLTQSQVAVARRLNITPEQYAAELAKLENV